MLEKNDSENRVAQAASDLDFIRKVMEASRYHSLKNGVFYQIWGLIIPLCSILNWILIHFELFRFIGLVWGIGIGLGSVSSFVIGFLKSKEEGDRVEDNLNGKVWIGILMGSVTILILELVGILPLVYGLFSLCLLLMLGAVVEASLTGLKGFFLIAGGWLAVGISLIIFKDHAAPLFMGFMTFPLSFISGTILTILYKKEKKSA